MPPLTLDVYTRWVRLAHETVAQTGAAHLDVNLVISSTHSHRHRNEIFCGGIGSLSLLKQML